MERIKKHFVQIIKENGLLISIQCNMKSVNYLDVTLNLDGNSFQPSQLTCPIGAHIGLPI